HRLPQIPESVDPLRHRLDREGARVEARAHFGPLERRRRRGAGMRACAVRDSNGLATGVACRVQVDASLAFLGPWSSVVVAGNCRWIRRARMSAARSVPPCVGCPCQIVLPGAAPAGKRKTGRCSTTIQLADSESPRVDDSYKTRLLARRLPARYHR